MFFPTMFIKYCYFHVLYIYIYHTFLSYKLDAVFGTNGASYPTHPELNKENVTN